MMVDDVIQEVLEETDLTNERADQREAQLRSLPASHRLVPPSPNDPYDDLSDMDEDLAMAIAISRSEAEAPGGTVTESPPSKTSPHPAAVPQSPQSVAAAGVLPLTSETSSIANIPAPPDAHENELFLNEEERRADRQKRRQEKRKKRRLPRGQVAGVGASRVDGTAREASPLPQKSEEEI